MKNNHRCSRLQMVVFASRFFMRSIIILGLVFSMTANAATVVYAVAGTWDQGPAPPDNAYYVRYEYDPSLARLNGGWLDFDESTGGFVVTVIANGFLNSLVWDALRVSPAGTSTSMFGIAAWDFDQTPGIGTLQLQFDPFGNEMFLNYGDNVLSYYSYTNINFVSIPATFWLFSSGLIGLLGAARKKSLAH